MNIKNKIPAVLLGLSSITALSGYLAFRHMIVRRKSAVLAKPDNPKTEGRKYFAAHFDTQKEWLDSRERKEVSLRNKDGHLLKGWFFPAEKPTRQTALCIHGYRCSSFPEYFYIMRMYLEEQSMNVLLVDNAAHGESEGRNIGFGFHDRTNTLLWVEWLCRYTGEDSRILLHGVSMGAATVLMTAAEPSLPNNVKWVVADCGYSSLKKEITHVMKNQMKLPAFPLYHLSSLFCKLLAGYFYGEVEPKECAGRIKIPLLLIHGTSDNFVPTEMVHEIYDACTAPKDLLLVDGAAHAESYLIDPATYSKAVRRLLSLT